MDPKTYLEFVARTGNRAIREGFRWPGYEAMVLELGKSYVPARRPKGLRKQKDRECFNNAALLALRDRTLRYVEGWATSSIGIPVLHAWCVTTEGRVVDPTWRSPEKATGYYGIEFDIEDVIAAISASGFYGLIGSDWRIGFPLLRTGNPRPERSARRERTA